MERNNVHISIVKKDAYLRPRLLPSGFGCPLCNFKTVSDEVIERHLRNHNTNGVHFQENIICRCNLPCRVRGHFHCLFCDKTIIRKDDIALHLTDCQKKSNVVQPTLVTSSPETLHYLVLSVSEDHSYFLSPSVSSETTDHSYAHTSQASPDTPTLSTDFDQTAPAPTSDQPMIQEEEETLPITHVKCPHCPITLYKCNLAVHIKRKHNQHEDITANTHLKSSSINQSNGNQAVSKPSHSFSVPLHVQRKTWSQHHTCEMEDCHHYHPLNKHSGLSRSMYHRSSSVDCCSTMALRPSINHYDTKISKKWWKTRLHYVNIGML